MPLDKIVDDWLHLLLNVREMNNVMQWNLLTVNTSMYGAKTTELCPPRQKGKKDMMHDCATYKYESLKISWRCRF
jgi:hypothetical protein